MPTTTLIVGVGNPLARDEGVGIRAVQGLRDADLPAGVRVLDAGTDLLAVVPQLAEADRVILIDAVRAGRTPGSIYRMTLDELLARAKDGPDWQSAHALTLPAAVRLAQAAGITLPPTVVFGVEPKEVALGEGLTAEVEAVLPALLEKVLAEVRTGR